VFIYGEDPVKAPWMYELEGIALQPDYATFVLINENIFNKSIGYPYGGYRRSFNNYVREGDGFKNIQGNVYLSDIVLRGFAGSLQ
jgi:hypothetical protein